MAQPAPARNLRYTPTMYWDTILFGVVTFAVLFVRFLHPSLILGYYQDDFFYYLKVAQNIAAHGESTFNGLNLTNGYHPLWMLVLVAVCLLAKGTWVFVCVQIISAISGLLTYRWLRSTLARVATEGTARWAAFALGMASLQLLRYGMEVTLTLPLLALLLALLVRRGIPTDLPRAAWLGFIAALVVLSRLDAAIFIALLCLFLLPTLLRSPKPLLPLTGFLLAFAPLLLLYFGYEWHRFHLLTPVSGLAKQIKTTLLPSAQTWLSLVPSNRMRAIVVLPQLILLLAGLTVAAFSRTQTRRSAHLRNIALATAFFPILHWTVLSLVSEWEMWPWYYYSLTAGCVGAVMLLSLADRRIVAHCITGTISALLVIYSAVYIKQGPDSIAVLTSSRSLASFMDQHPGVWMMGDQAGTTGYLSHQPIVQMEGLVMDREFLQLLRKNTPLPALVKRYKGDYFAFPGNPAEDGCFYISEPSHAGPHSAKMQGKACVKPLATFLRDGSKFQVVPADAIQPWSSNEAPAARK